MKYVVVYISDSLSDQIITDGIDFDTASQFAAEMTAEALFEGSTLNQEAFIVQPVVEKNEQEG